MFTKTNKLSKKSHNKTKRVYKNSHPMDENKYKNIIGTVDVDLFRKNIDFLRKKAKLDIMPVLKANAYGHGMIEMAKICRENGVTYLGVATLGEAIQIRDSGDKGRILGWLYDVYSDEINTAVSKNIDIGVFDEKHIPIISKKLPQGSKAKIHLFVDTGIDRNGVPYEKALEAAKLITSDSKFELVGLMSHFCCADDKNNRATLNQLHLFRTLRKEMENNNIKPELVHIANTSGILNYDISDFTLARSGSGIYGYGEKKLTPIMNVSSKIIQLKYIPKKQGIGYDRTYITKKKTYVGIVPIGYADFLPLTKTGRVSVMVNGTRRKVLGLESMDQIVIEAKKGDKLGDCVHVFGNKNKGFITGNELGKMGHTTVFNILTHMSRRVGYDYLHR
jgi:alanine racemase